MTTRYINMLAGLGLGLCLGLATVPVNAQSGGQAGTVLSADQIDDRYDAAKQRCDAMKGDDKELCMERAKADKEKAEAQAKAGKKKSEADRDAAQTSRKADYDMAMERCEAMSGDAQDKCEADAKARYGK